MLTQQQSQNSLQNYVVLVLLKTFYIAVKYGLIPPFKYNDGQNMTTEDIAKTIMRMAIGGTAKTPADNQFLTDLQKEITVSCQGKFTTAMTFSAAAGALGAGHYARAHYTTASICLLMSAILATFAAIVYSLEHVDKNSFPGLVENSFKKEISRVDYDRYKAFRRTGTTPGSFLGVGVGVVTRYRNAIW
jgi:hypothetical protein